MIEVVCILFVAPFCFWSFVSSRLSHEIVLLLGMHRYEKCFRIWILYRIRPFLFDFSLEFISFGGYLCMLLWISHQFPPIDQCYLYHSLKTIHWRSIDNWFWRQNSIAFLCASISTPYICQYFTFVSYIQIRTSGNTHSTPSIVFVLTKQYLFYVFSKYWNSNPTKCYLASE